MNRKLAILGASGHGKVIAEIAELLSWDISFFDDQFPRKKSIEHWEVIGDSFELYNRCNKFDGVIVAIGNNTIRAEKQYDLISHGANLVSLIHPSAVISKYSNINSGSVIMANSVINAFANIGQGSIINTGAIIEHDCQIGEFNHISPNATLAGNVITKNNVWIGAGAVIKNNVTINQNVMVGAGSVVINDLTENKTVMGIPAK